MGRVLMDDAAFEEQKARILKLYDTYVTLLGFRDWTVAVYYHRDPSSMPVQPPKQDRKHGVQIGMVAHPSWEYRSIGIAINMQCIADHDDATVERLFIHELMHGVVNEMRHIADDGHLHEERVVTWLSDIALWCIDHGKALGREEVMETDRAAAAILDAISSTPGWTE